jgi:segregation and condensation protein B
MELKSILEALLFQAQKPMSPNELQAILATTSEQSEDLSTRAFKRIRAEEIQLVLEELAVEIESSRRSFYLACVAGAWQFVSRPDYAPWLRVLLGEKPRPPRLSLPALETLAIIAYRQPITRAEIEQIRGVSVDGVMQTLLERGLTHAVGRAEVIGRPMTYGTTPFFLEYFGLRDLEGLPAAEELRRIQAQRPEHLLTAESGLATTPPDALTQAADEQMEMPLSATPAPAGVSAATGSSPAPPQETPPGSPPLNP